MWCENFIKYNAFRKARLLLNNSRAELHYFKIDSFNFHYLTILVKIILLIAYIRNDNPIQEAVIYNL